MQQPIAPNPNKLPRPLKVVRLIPVLDFGGVETTFLLEAEQIDRELFDFEVCTFWKMGRAAERIRATGAQVTSLEIDPSIRNPKATLALARFLRRERPDVLHASIGEANFHAALVSKICGVPVTILEEQGRPDRRLFGRAVHAVLYRLADATVGVSRSSCAYIRDREWAPADRVHLLYNAASKAYFDTPLTKPVRHDPFEFLAVGRLVEVKNHEFLLRAFRVAVDRVPNMRLTIVGDGPLDGELRELIGTLELGDKVTLSGFRGDVMSVLDGSDAFLIPSLSEGFSIAIIEAMARGVPPIVSNIDPLMEATEDLGRDWVVPTTDPAFWADAMTRMATLPEVEHRALRQAARRTAERFSPARHVDALQTLYTGLYAHARGL